MSLLLLGVRLGFLLAAGAFVPTALGYLLLFYERAAADGARGAARAVSRARVRAGIGAWARESGLHLVLAACWISGALPRGKLRTGAWLPRDREVRPGRPVLLVPGYALNRGTLRLLAARLEASGRPALAISLPYWKPIEALAACVAEGAGELQRATGSDRIDVVAHSRGGLAVRWWIQKMGGAGQVERFVSLGTGHRGTKMAAFGGGPSIPQQLPGSAFLEELNAAPLPEGIEWCAVNGGEDCMILPPGNDELPAPGKNVRVEAAGHGALLFSAAVWREVHAALRRSEEEGLLADIGDDETAEEAALRTLAELAR